MAEDVESRNRHHPGHPMGTHAFSHGVTSRSSGLNASAAIRNALSADWRQLSTTSLAESQEVNSEISSQKCRIREPILTSDGRIEYRTCSAPLSPRLDDRLRHALSCHLDVHYQVVRSYADVVDRVQQVLPLTASSKLNSQGNRPFLTKPVGRCRGCTRTVTLITTCSSKITTLVNEPMRGGLIEEIVSLLKSKKNAFLKYGSARKQGDGLLGFAEHDCSEHPLSCYLLSASEGNVPDPQREYPKLLFSNDDFLEPLYCYECKRMHKTLAENLAHSCTLSSLPGKNRYRRILEECYLSPVRQWSHAVGTFEVEVTRRVVASREDNQTSTRRRQNGISRKNGEEKEGEPREFTVEQAVAATLERSRGTSEVTVKTLRAFSTKLDKLLNDIGEGGPLPEDSLSLLKQLELVASVPQDDNDDQESDQNVVTQLQESDHHIENRALSEVAETCQLQDKRKCNTNSGFFKKARVDEVCSSANKENFGAYRDNGLFNKQVKGNENDNIFNDVPIDLSTKASKVISTAPVAKKAPLIDHGQNQEASSKLHQLLLAQPPSTSTACLPPITLPELAQTQSQQTFSSDSGFLPKTPESTNNDVQTPKVNEENTESTLTTTIELVIEQSKNQIESTSATAPPLPEDNAQFSGEFTQIEENVYHTSAESLKEKEEMDKCLCKRTEEDVAQRKSGCTDGSCTNRHACYECDECVFENLCRNKRMTNKDRAPIEVFEAGKKGRGVRATENLPSGTLVIEMVGEIISRKEKEKREAAYAKEGLWHHYQMTLKDTSIGSKPSETFFIDQTKMGNISRFINSSCKPNCEANRWIADGNLRLGIFTCREVKANEELTYDYGSEFIFKNKKCLCGACDGKKVTTRAGKYDKKATVKARKSDQKATTKAGKCAKKVTGKTRGSTRNR